MKRWLVAACLLAAAAGGVQAQAPKTATAIVAGTVIGSGVFKKPQSIADSVPGFPLIATVWILGGTVLVLTGIWLLTKWR